MNTHATRRSSLPSHTKKTKTKQRGGERMWIKFAWSSCDCVCNAVHRGEVMRETGRMGRGREDDDDDDDARWSPGEARDRGKRARGWVGEASPSRRCRTPWWRDGDHGEVPPSPPATTTTWKSRRRRCGIGLKMRQRRKERARCTPSWWTCWLLRRRYEADGKRARLVAYTVGT